MNEDKFKKIDDFNKVLSGINTLALASLQGLGEIDNISQAIIDDYCIRISEQINSELDKKRNELIKSLKQAYLSSNEIISQLEPLVKLSITDLPSVISAVNKIIGFLAGPYQIAIEFVTILTPKLGELTENINQLASIKQSIPPIGNYNFNKLNISIKPINIGDITS